MDKIACFTGHRKFDCPQKTVQQGIEQLIQVAIDNKVNHFWCGMAIGTDLLAAKVLACNGLPWTAIIPCLDQSSKWPKHYQKTYFALLSQASDDIILQSEYSSGCFNRRNAWMVKHSDLLLSVWNNKHTKGSGTYNTIRMAQKKGLTIVNFNPLTNSIVYFKPKPKPSTVSIQLTIQFD